MDERSVISFPLGVSASENTIEGISSSNYHSDDAPPRYKIAFIGGLSGTQECHDVYIKGMAVLPELPIDIGFIASDLTSSHSPVKDQVFPPEGGFFFNRDSVESRYVWRDGWHGPHWG